MKHTLRTRRTVVRAVRWTPEEWRHVTRAAHLAGRPTSVFIRESMLSEAPASPTSLPRPRPIPGRHEERSLPRSTRFKPSEWKAVQEAAAAVQLSPSRFMRAAILGHRILQRADAEAIRQLARAGTNLNQLARLANATGQVRLDRRLAEVLAEVERAIRRIAS